MLGILVEITNGGRVPPKYTIKRLNPQGDDGVIGVRLWGKDVNDFLHDYQGPPSRYRRWHTSSLPNDFVGLWVDPLDDRFDDEATIRAFLEEKGLRPTDTYPMPVTINEYMHRHLIGTLTQIYRNLRPLEYLNARSLRTIMGDIALGLIKEMPLKPVPPVKWIGETYIQYVQDIVKGIMAEEGDRQ